MIEMLTSGHLMGQKLFYPVKNPFKLDPVKCEFDSLQNWNPLELECRSGYMSTKPASHPPGMSYGGGIGGGILKEKK